MSISEMDSKVKELRELHRMAEELAAEIDSRIPSSGTWTQRAWTPSAAPTGA